MHLAAGMEDFYRIPFESFERYSPYGTPAEVAEFLQPYVEAGCSAFNLIPRARDAATALRGCRRGQAPAGGLTRASTTDGSRSSIHRPSE